MPLGKAYFTVLIIPGVCLIGYAEWYRRLRSVVSVTADRCCGYCVCWDGDGVSWVFWPPGGFRHSD